MSQVDKSNYRFERYVFHDRWSFYYWQIKEAVMHDKNGKMPNSFLVIGGRQNCFRRY